MPMCDHPGTHRRGDTEGRQRKSGRGRAGQQRRGTLFRKPATTPRSNMRRTRSLSRSPCRRTWLRWSAAPRAGGTRLAAIGEELWEPESGIGTYIAFRLAQLGRAAQRQASNSPCATAARGLGPSPIAHEPRIGKVALRLSCTAPAKSAPISPRRLSCRCHDLRAQCQNSFMTLRRQNMLRAWSMRILACARPVVLSALSDRPRSVWLRCPAGYGGCAER